MRFYSTWCFLLGAIILLSFGESKAQEEVEFHSTIDEIVPQVYCINGLAINFTQEFRERELSAQEINVGSYDNVGIKTLIIDNHVPKAEAPRIKATDNLRFTTKDLGKHKIDLWVEDFGGNWARNSTYVVVSDLTIDEKEIASQITLNNYPNPFTDYTQISFEMPTSGQANLTILDSKGILIKEIKGKYSKGEQVIKINKSDLPKIGIYFYQISSDQGSITKSMIMVNY